MNRIAFLVAALASTVAPPVLANETEVDTVSAQQERSQQGPPAGVEGGGPPPGVMGESVFDGDFLTIGIGAGLSPSYSGSNDYAIFPLPVITGSVGGVDFNPRPAGVAVDFVPDTRGKTSFDLGVAFRVRSDRVDQIQDDVVELLPDLDRAVEIGPTAGVSFPGIFNRFDSLSFQVDALWDIGGAHDGMSVSPSVTYFTPLGRATFASFTLSTTYVDDDFATYYYTVSPADALISGLPSFQADGGFESVGANVFLAHDLDGNALNGGWSIVGIGGYSRLLGDAKATPFTSIRGSANQFLFGAGVAFTF